MYKGHWSRREYMKWCEDQWDKNHNESVHAGAQSINDWAHGWSHTGAVGTLDVFSQARERDGKQELLVFGYLLPGTADEIVRAFAEGLEIAVDKGLVPHARYPFPSFEEKEAPTSNTGLTSPPTAN